VNSLTEQLEQDINKLVGILKPEDELKEILKRKMTKKELKYFNLKMANASKEEMLKELKCDDERFEEIEKHTMVKINQEKLKKELVVS
jgi:hypothetical protein